MKQIIIAVDATGKPTTAASFIINTTGQLQGLSIIRAVNQTNGLIYPISHPFMSYSQNSTLVNITNVTGLPVGNNFQLTVIAWG